MQNNLNPSNNSSSSSSSSSRNWLQTKKRPPASDDPPSLPLDWTRVQRRRRRDDNEDCCPVIDSSLAPLRPDQQLVEGMAIFCLHEPDPPWFQGYFVSLGSSTSSTAKPKPWGLLAVQQPVDDCLQSPGYRQCKVTVFPYPATGKMVLPGVEWTGGDMMRLASPQVQFDPNQIQTGHQAVPQIEKLFGGILDKCRRALEEQQQEEEEEESPSSVLDLIPDVVVVSGSMKLVVPVPKKKEEEDDDDF